MGISSINFEAASNNAELKDATEALRNWLLGHPELQYFTYDQICRELGHRMPAEFFNRVLLRLVAAGELDVKYRVKIAENEYSEEEFDSIDEIPECVFDSAFEPVRVDDSAKVTAYTSAR